MEGEEEGSGGECKWSEAGEGQGTREEYWGEGEHNRGIDDTSYGIVAANAEFLFI